MTYEYACTDPACQAEWEAEQRITEPPQTVCPHCQKATAKRLISGNGAFVLNGSGWSKDGYGN